MLQRSTVFFFNCLLVCSLQAQVGGNNVYRFLNIPNSARAAALGGNVVSIVDQDLHTVGDNPALLDSNLHQHLAMSYVNHLSDINSGRVAYAQHFNKIGTMAFALNFLSYGNFVETDFTGQELGNFTAADYAFTASYSRPLPKLDSLFSVGGGLKLIYSVLEQYTSVGVGVDVGATYHSKNKNFSSGLVVKNLGSQIKSYTSNNNEPLPFEVQLGLSKKIQHAPIRATLLLRHLQKWDLTYPDPSNPLPNDPVTGEPINKTITLDKFMRHAVAAIEFLPSKNFHIRFSYDYKTRQEMKLASRTGLAGIGFGAGLKISKFKLDYGRYAYHLAGAANHISISTNFGEFKTKRTASAQP